MILKIKRIIILFQTKKIFYLLEKEEDFLIEGKENIIGIISVKK
jgi:hypothetical protein